MANPAVTIFTPTYNRAHVLTRAYKSLLAQTCYDFEWLILDDGSTDDTSNLAAQWQQSAPFPIRYIRFPHRGKPRTMKAGFPLCRGTYLYELDSDDEMTPNAVETGLALWASLPNPQAYHDVVSWGWIPEKGESSGRPFPSNMNDLSPAKQRAVVRKLGAGRSGEQRSFRRTEHCQQYPFYLPEELSFIPENVLFHLIYCDYKRFYTNHCFMIYHEGEQADSLMRTVSDARPAYYYYIYHFNTIFPRDPTTTLKEYTVSAASLCYAAARCHWPLKRILQDLRPLPARLLCVGGYAIMKTYQKFRP